MFRERVFKRIRSLFNRQDQYLDHNQKINLPFFNRLKPLTKNRISYVLSCFFLLISKRERDRSHSGWQTYSWLPKDTFYLYFSFCKSVFLRHSLGYQQILFSFSSAPPLTITRFLVFTYSALQTISRPTPTQKKCTLVTFFTGPRCPWGPVYGSRPL